MTAAGRSGGPLSHCTLANNLLLSIPMCDMHLSGGAETTTRVTLDDHRAVKFTDVNRLDWIAVRSCQRTAAGARGRCVRVRPVFTEKLPGSLALFIHLFVYYSFFVFSLSVVQTLICKANL